MKILGVIGGMGPMATIDFLRKLIIYTDARSDKDHIHTLTDSYCAIPDRSSYILGRGEDPAEKLIDTAVKLQNMGAEVVVMPCNTAHYFYEDIKRNLEVEFINMIEETAKVVAGEDRVGLLATEGTYHSRIYEDIFKGYGIEVVQPDEDIKLLINRVIYRIKGGGHSLREHMEEVEEIIRHFNVKNIEKIILGCTELPLIFDGYSVAGISFIDPTEALAHAAIKAMGKLIKKRP